MIRILKTQTDWTLLEFASTQMVKQVKSELLNIEHCREFFVTSIPARRSSGAKIDHNKILAKSVAKKLSIPYRESLIFVKTTKKQSLLSRQQRLTNLRQSMRAKRSAKEKPSFAIIIDDVTTTGATLQEARRALSAHGIRETYAFTLAH